MDPLVDLLTLLGLKGIQAFAGITHPAKQKGGDREQEVKSGTPVKGCKNLIPAASTPLVLFIL